MVQENRGWMEELMKRLSSCRKKKQLLMMFCVIAVNKSLYWYRKKSFSLWTHWKVISICKLHVVEEFFLPHPKHLVWVLLINLTAAKASVLHLSTCSSLWGAPQLQHKMSIELTGDKSGYLKHLSIHKDCVYQLRIRIYRWPENKIPELLASHVVNQNNQHCWIWDHCSGFTAMSISISEVVM